MKVIIKEFYDKGEKAELLPTTPVASIALTNDFGEYLYEFFITKASYDAMKAREREYKAAHEKAEKREGLLIEYLAEVEHNQWVNWSREVAKREPISLTRRRRWETLWIPYGLLSEETKEEDRRLARKALNTVRDNEAFWDKEDRKYKRDSEEAVNSFKPVRF